MRHAAETELLGDEFAIQNDRAACQRAGTERHHVQTVAAVEQARHIAVQHLDIGQQMMRKEHGLSALKVRVTRHQRLTAALRAFDERGLHGVHEIEDRFDLRAAIQTHIRGHLVIAAACGVQFRAGGADAASQLGLDIHVHVFESGLPFELARLNVCEDAGEAVLDLFLLLRGQDAGFEQSFRVRDGARDVMRIQPPVKGHRFSVALHESAGFLGKTTFPHDVWYWGREGRAGRRSGKRARQMKTASRLTKAR